MQKVAKSNHTFGQTSPNTRHFALLTNESAHLDNWIHLFISPCTTEKEKFNFLQDWKIETSLEKGDISIMLA